MLVPFPVHNSKLKLTSSATKANAAFFCLELTQKLPGGNSISFSNASVDNPTLTTPL